MLRLRAAVLAMAACCLWANHAAAYDLSRAYDDSDRVERGFVVAHGGLWFPAFGTFNEYHQLSLQFAGEFGFRVASIRGEHNIFIVTGMMFSPQKLDPDAVDDRRHRNSLLFLGWVGARYVPGFLCLEDGLGCPFAELRVGAVWEAADDRSGHDGPSGDFTFLPGVGYRFRFGSSFQIGARADIAISGEDDLTTLGWVSLDAFLGFGW